MNYKPGDLVALQATIASKKPVSAEDFTAFLKEDNGANYRDADFVPFVEMMVGTMPGERRFGAALEAYNRTPSHRMMFGDIRLLELARDSLQYLSGEPRQAAERDLLKFSPFDSRFRDEMEGRAPASNRPSIGAVVRTLLTNVGAPRPAMA